VAAAAVVSAAAAATPTAPSSQQPSRQQPQQQPPRAHASRPSASQQPPPPPPPAPKQTRPREDAQTVFVQGVRYTMLEYVGRGGPSKVFKVMGPGCRIFALKRIRLQGRDPEAAAGFADEIELLRRLQGKPNIIQLIDAQVFDDEGLINVVQECCEIDLTRLLAKHAEAVARLRAEENGRGGGGGGSGGNNASGASAGLIDENFVRLYWQQMLRAVETVHDLRIVHSDLKPANFLLVEGQLKPIDFGIAKAIQAGTTSIAREAQVGTLNYMSPEAILGGSNNILGAPALKVGRASDVWSIGCIL
jgi:serine/threonine-protein kinase TTK/MPS1